MSLARIVAFVDKTSLSAARRLIEGGGIRVEGIQIKDPNAQWHICPETGIQFITNQDHTKVFWCQNPELHKLFMDR